MDRDQVFEEITRAMEEGNDEELFDLLDDLVDIGVLEFCGVYPIN